MRSLFIFLLSTIAIKLSAQTDNRIFYSQLMVVFSDLGNHFAYLKGELKETQNGDSLFESNNNLEGTKENTILLSSSNGYAYQAIINDSTSEAGSQFILKAWKQKLTDELTGSFSQVEKEFHSGNDKNIDGYQYSSEKIIVLLLRHKAGDNSYWINLTIKPNKL